MCGISGAYHYTNSDPVVADTLRQMRDTMVHRGPDGAGLWVSDDRKVGLAHRRLSIIDLSEAAAQPMCNEDGSIWVTFNGEIYNHLGLRRELIVAGHSFRSDHSDTEVLVHGYEEWGIDGLLRRIEGDYAFAIWDVRRACMSLARDRVGVKPLYFSLQDGRLLFASEIKAIIAHPAVCAEVEPVAMYHYLSFLTTPAPLTMFKGIYKLPAGYCLQLGTHTGFKAWRYWDALPGQGIGRNETRNLSPEAREAFYVDGIRRRLGEAVERRMMSDVSIGVFLSGGIDSSTNVALMGRHTDRPLETFTVGFSDHQHLNELEYADLVARKFKTRHHQVLINERDMRSYLDNLIHHQDEPIADWVCIPLYFVSRLARENGVSVIQVGEGSDEQFSGYAGYMAHLKLYRQYWQPFRDWLPGYAQKGVAGLARAAATLRPGLLMYADIIDRAARDREHFWSGATVFPELAKRQLVARGAIGETEVPPELIDSGLLPVDYLQPDSFNVIRHFQGDIAAAKGEQDVLTRMIYNEFKLRLPELLLMRVDKIAMSVSLEARVPFLDHQLVEWTMDIPMSDKIRGNEPKYLLKKAVQGLIPDEIINRKKMGFGAPMSQWLRGEFGRDVRARIMASSLLKLGFFNTDYINSLFHAHATGRQDHGLYIWTLFNLTAWYDYWVAGEKQSS